MFLAFTLVDGRSWALADWSITQFGANPDGTTTIITRNEDGFGMVVREPFGEVMARLRAAETGSGR